MDKFSTYRAQYEEQFIKAAKSFKSATAQIDAKYVLDMRNTRQNYNLKLTAIQKRLREIVAFLGSSAVDWPDKIWDSHIQNNKIPVGIRIGTGILKGQFENLEVPVLVQILNRGNLIFIAKGAAKKTAIQALQSSLLKIVATFQPEKLKLILVD
ncbi:MAG: hypothetical protein ABIU06_20970, partial [Anaerolineales bacterium]